MANRYYLNNYSDEPIVIGLTAKRTIQGKSSFPLNDKDVKIYKELKAKRRGKTSFLDNLRLSTIRIEDDSNYGKADLKPVEVPVDPNGPIEYNEPVAPQGEVDANGSVEQPEDETETETETDVPAEETGDQPEVPVEQPKDETETETDVPTEETEDAARKALEANIDANQFV